jgi:hypothetical protein
MQEPRKIPKSDYMDLVVRTNAYVQSGEAKTVRQLLDRFRHHKRELVERRIGSMVCKRDRQYWKVGTFEPSEEDMSARSIGEQERNATHAKIGANIAAHHIDDIIEVLRPWGDAGESEYLKPVKNGACAGCDQPVTNEMQCDLKLSKRVFCQKCGVTLFGPGE